ncbi:Protein NLRC5, partial [Stylophora pistillata]
MLDLNAVVLTSSGESKDVQKYADLLVGKSFFKKSGGRNFVYLIYITDEDFHSELFPELISAPVCSSQPPVDNLVNNENNNIDVPFTENHCLSLVREIDIDVDVETVEDAALLKNVLPLLTAPREIRIGISRPWVEKEEEEEEEEQEEEEAFKDQLIESAINGISFTDNLHSLELIDINIAEKCAAFISDSVQHSPNLLKLDLSFIPLHSGVSHLAENLHHVPQLTELVLWNVQMGEKECAALAASLKYLKNLVILNIEDNALGHGIIELAKNLNNVPNLTELDLRNTNMGEDEALALAHALKCVPVLTYLHLDSNPLGRGIRDLVQHLSSVPELEELDLKGVQMTRTECEELYTAVNERQIYACTDYR